METSELLWFAAFFHAFQITLSKGNDLFLYSKKLPKREIILNLF
jgi:hypothetical protein